VARTPRSQRTPESGIPGVGAFAALAFAVVLIPAILVAAILRSVGASLGVACMLGLLMAFVGMGIYPRMLRWLRWLPGRQGGS
jgi:membrane protein YdbS with pleckstrin-like domain